MKTMQHSTILFLAVSLLCVAGKTSEGKDSGQQDGKLNIGCELPEKQLEGNDLTVLMEDPEASWDKTSLTVFGYKNYGIRSERYRYIVYADGSEELYDHEKDKWEWHNLAHKPEYAAVKEKMRKGIPAHHESPGA